MKYTGLELVIISLSVGALKAETDTFPPTTSIIVKDFDYEKLINSGMVFSCCLEVGSNVTLKIFNSLGEEIETIVDKYLEAGEHSSSYIVSSSLPSGIYLYRLQAGTFVDTKKMVLVR